MCTYIQTHTYIHRKGKHDNMTSRHKDKNLHNIRISRKHKTENMREHLLKSKQISL